jgi:hypothetical protein
MLAHALCHEHPRAVLYDERPACNLRSNIEELRYHALTVVLDLGQFAEGGFQALVRAFVTVLRHICEPYQQQQNYYDGAYVYIRLYQNVEVVVFDNVKLCLRKSMPLCRVHRTHACLHVLHGYEHAGERSYRVERLGEVEALCGGLFAAHAVNIRVATGFEKRQSARHYEVGQQEREVYSYGLCRHEEQRSRRIERQPDEHSGLERVSLDEHRRRKGHHEIS